MRPVWVSYSVSEHGCYGRWIRCLPSLRHVSSGVASWNAAGGSGEVCRTLIRMFGWTGPLRAFALEKTAAC